MDPSTTWTISQLAQEFSVTPRTIRFYEDEGILSPERNARKRVYRARDRARLKLALRGKRLGLSLAEIRSLIDMYESPQDTRRQLETYLAILTQHRQMLERKREDIDLTLGEITEQETQCRLLLSGQSQSPR